MASPLPSWLMLITNLPGRNQTLRMRIWRALKASGASLLRDGVYILPYSAMARRVFEEQRVEINKAKGSAYVLPFESDSPDQNGELMALFDRTGEYKALKSKLDVYRRSLAKLSEVDARRRLATIARDAAALDAINFIEGKSQAQLQGALADVTAALNAQFSPNEPQAVHAKIPRRDPEDYQGRTWATREHLWIDRVCSAWLIQRFIDKSAKFRWLKRIKDQPKRSLGFDFDGAEFSHTDSKVTFEVLLVSFGLEGDPSLRRLGTLVHFLDVGGIPVAEAAGLASIITGVRELQSNDDALLRTVAPILDSMYAAFSVADELR